MKHRDNQIGTRKIATCYMMVQKGQLLTTPFDIVDNTCKDGNV